MWLGREMITTSLLSLKVRYKDTRIYFVKRPALMAHNTTVFMYKVVSCGSFTL